MAKKNGKSKSVLDVPVKFGGVSIGQETARIGVTFDRSSLELSTADEVFCGHRLNGRVQLGQRDDAPGQGKLIEDVDFEIEGMFDAKKLSVSAGQIGTGLTFSLSDVDIAELARFSKGTGRLIVEHVSEIPDDAPDDSEAEDDEAKHVPGSLKFEGEPRDCPIKKLFKGAILKSLNEADIECVGDLVDFTDTGKKLADIPGIGPGKSEVIAETMINFWSDQGPQGAGRKK